MRMSLYTALSRLGGEQGYVCSRCLLRAKRQRLSAPTPSRNSTLRSFASVRLLDDASPTPKPGVLALLESRGYINQLAGDRDGLAKVLDRQRVGFYAGIDPTAPSLHLGHLLPFMVLFWLYFHGHNVVSLVGGATARVGDPSGRLTSRTKTVESSRSEDFVKMSAQLGQIWQGLQSNGSRHGHEEGHLGSYSIQNNADWLDNLNILDFLRLMGNSMRVGTMLGRDTVRNKLEKGDGMSFSELSYPLLQAWDWWHLYRSPSNILVQVGGGDQYGNIVAGMDAIKAISALPQAVTNLPSDYTDAETGRILLDRTPMGLTVPLLTTSSGEKFGKSAGNAVWLDKSMTSTFDLYGFLLRTADEDVERYLKLFTFLPLETISELMQAHAVAPGKRLPQHALAQAVLEIVHGREEAEAAEQKHRASRRPSLETFVTGVGEHRDGSQERFELPRNQVMGQSIAGILARLQGVSKSQASRTIASGGLYVAKKLGAGDGLEFVQYRDGHGKITGDMFVGGKVVLRVGKWKVRVVEAV